MAGLGDTLTIEQILDRIEDHNLVRRENGHITFDPKIIEALQGASSTASAYSMSDNGRIPITHYAPMTAQDAARAMKRLEEYAETINRQTDDIRAQTRVTTRPTIVMASPDHLISLAGAVNWHVLNAHLEAAGAVIQNTSAYHAPSRAHQTWTRDNFILAPDGRALFFQNPEYNTKSWDGIEPNTIAQRNGFETQGHPVATIPLQAELTETDRRKNTHDDLIEGGDILQHPQSNTVFIAAKMVDGQASPLWRAAAQKVADTLGMQLVLVPKAQKPPFYHLDTFMSVLPDGSAVLLPDATTPEAREKIAAAIKGHGDMLELPVKPGETQEQANNRRYLATNLVTVNGNSFTPNAVPEMRDFLTAHGFNVIEGPYRIADSGAHCLTNFLYRRKADGRTDVSENTTNFPQLAYADMPVPPPSFTPSPTPAAPEPLSSSPQIT